MTDKKIMENNTDKLRTKLNILFGLLRQFQTMMPEDELVMLDISTEPGNGNVLKIIFYKYLIKNGYNGEPTAFRHSITWREFEFNEAEMDKCIDRLRKKIERTNE